MFLWLLSFVLFLLSVFVFVGAIILIFMKLIFDKGIKLKNSLIILGGSAVIFLISITLFIGGLASEPGTTNRSVDSKKEDEMEQIETGENEDSKQEKVNEKEKAKEEVKKKKNKESPENITDKENKNTAKDDKVVIKGTKEDMFKSKFETHFQTGIEKPNIGISDSDYIKYNEIMDYLYDYPDKDETTLFKELSKIYNEPANELKQFIEDNMQAVINHELGKVPESKLKDKDVQNNVETFMMKNIKSPNLLNLLKEELDVDGTGVRKIVKGNFLYEDKKYDLIIKLEYTGDFQNVEVFQLKVNEVNIDL